MAEDRSIKAPEALEGEGKSPPEMALEGDIPRPSARVLREEEAAAGFSSRRRQPQGNLVANLAAVIRHRRQLEAEGKKVSANDPALQDFLKHGGGDEISAEILAATAAIMAALPKRPKEKKKRLHQLYLEWARQASTAVITRVIQTFKSK